ncbi:uncharacterized protein LOC144885435 [Branchiostoma floridae x Branchiostoma japonicum]
MEGVTEDLTQELQTVADNIGPKDWRRLLRRLGVKDIVLDQIHHDYVADGLVEMSYRGLRKWTQQDGERATLQKLLAALKKIRRRDLIDKLSADRAADTNSGRTALTDSPYDPETEHTVPKQLVSEDTYAIFVSNTDVPFWSRIKQNTVDYYYVTKYTMEEVTAHDLTQELQTVAENIGSKHWKRLLRRLGLKENELDEIRHDYIADGLVEMVYQGLLKWKQRKGKEATLKNLLAGLEKTGRRDLIDILSTGHAADTNTGRTALSHCHYDPETEQTVPKQLMSEDIPCSARLKKHSRIPGVLKTLKYYLTVRPNVVKWHELKST